MAKKKTQTQENVVASPILHWATIAANPGMLDTLPIKTKFLRVTATNLDEASKLSLAYDLFRGKGPKTLQEQFDKLTTKAVAEFQKVQPDFEFVVGGRPRGRKTGEPTVQTPEAKPTTKSKPTKKKSA